QLLALAEPRRHLLARQRVRLLVLLPSAAREIAPDDALEVDALGLPHDHEAPGQLVAVVAQRGRKVRHHARDQVVLLKGIRLREPEDRQLGQDLAAVRDAVGQDAVERRDAIGGHHQQPVVGELVGVADLALREELEGKLGLCDCGTGDHRVFTPRPRRSNARSVCSRPAHGSNTASRALPIRLINSWFFSSWARNPGPRSRSASMAASCTITYASSRDMPDSTSAVNARPENATPPPN